MKSREKSVGFWSMLGGLKKTDDGAGIEKPRPVRFWAEAHLSTQFPKEEKHRTETIVLVEYTGEREREREMAYYSSSLPITAPATGCFQEHHHLKCGAVALNVNWSNSYQYARMSKSKSKVSSSRILFRCNSQLADLAPATSAAYGLLLLGGGLFACKLFHFFFKF